MSGDQLQEMDPLAKKALLRLLISANKHAAGVAVREPVLTKSSLTDYHRVTNLRAKESFEAVLAFAQAEGAIKLWRPRHDPQGLIERVALVDVDKLASILGETPYSAQVQAATRVLCLRFEKYPVLSDVTSYWERLKKVRGSGPEDSADWVHACDVIDYCLAQVSQGVFEAPVRDISARLFKDSKRIEVLTPYLDVLLQSSIESDARSQFEVLQELGLFREPQPVRLAGNVFIRRERGVLPLDRPYCALPPSTVEGLGSVPSQLLTIENLTTFHVWARQNCDSNVLCLYTAGMPSPAWRAMYLRLLRELPADVQVLHWGDVDEGGFRIAAYLSRYAKQAGRVLRPWRMRPGDIPQELRRDAPPRTLERMIKYANDAGWTDVAGELADFQIIAEQEG